MAESVLAQEPLLGLLLAYWERKRGTQPMPRRRDIDPLEMPPRLLPQLQLAEQGAGGRLRFRLVGTAVVDAIGKDPTGRVLDEVFAGEERDFLMRLFDATQRTRRPAAGRCWLIKPRGPGLGAAWLATPLSEDGREVTMILAAASFRLARHRTLSTERDAAEGAIEVL